MWNTTCRSTRIYPYSAEDWLQKQIAAINTNLAAAVYPATPEGATVRVRINTIGITATNPELRFPPRRRLVHRR